jgi:flagellar basal-body rod protein FlgG
MTQAFEIAAIGLVAQQKALDIIANNVANINTPSFKRSDVRFAEIIAQRLDPANPSAALGNAPSVAGVSARARLSLSEQGEIQRTERALDIAIDGDGFIELMGPSGQTMLWRGGALTIQDDGLLASADGLALRAMINVPANTTELTIGADGIVKARAASTDEAIDIGQIMLVRINDSTLVERLDGGLYRLAEGEQVTASMPGEDGAGELIQGASERSNVQINDEMIRLMIVQRAYAANAQIVQAADQLMAIANSLRR